MGVRRFGRYGWGRVAAELCLAEGGEESRGAR